MTITEFAGAIGVSTATVSRAFSGKGRISAATRARILERARELGYRPNRMAASMGRRRCGAIGFVYEATAHLDCDYYLAELSVGVSQAAAAAGQALQIVTVPADTALATERLDDTLYAGGLDGVLIYLDSPWAAGLRATADALGLPHLTLDNTREPSDGVISVGAQIEAASRTVGGYFRRLGRRAPAFISGTHDARKLAGLRTGLAESAGALVVDPGGASFADGYAAAERLLRERPATDAIFCANDVLAVGAIRALRDAGRQVPDDIAVIGCDDLRMAAYHCPALSTIRLPKQTLGSLAVRSLLARIAGDPAPAPALDACELISRESA